RVVDVEVVELHGPLGACARDLLVHPVDAADHRRLAATGGTDDRGDLVGGKGEADVLDRVRGPVVRVEVLERDRVALAGGARTKPFVRLGSYVRLGFGPRLGGRQFLILARDVWRNHASRLLREIARART